MDKTLTPLCELAKTHQTDKGGWHTWYGGVQGTTCHNYTPTYHALFADRRAEVKRVLEIGVNSGASLRMWADYFPNAEVIGLDIRRDCLFNEGRIRCLEANQASPASLHDAVEILGLGPGEFDLIVDDGSHELDHQLISAQTLLPYVKLGGYYIIEDIALDCRPQIVTNRIACPPGYLLSYLPTGRGIGIAHCDANCPHCKGSEGECLIAYRRLR